MISLPRTEDVEHRECLEPSTTALMMNGRYVSFSPVAFSNSARRVARIRAMPREVHLEDRADVRRCVPRTRPCASLMSCRIFGHRLDDDRPATAPAAAPCDATGTPAGRRGGRRRPRA
jgi:hypothetical protein